MRMLGKALTLAGDADRILDVPCGTGRLVASLLPRTQELVCADQARAMIDEARRRPLTGAPGPSFAQASAFALPFPDRAFDLTICWRLIHHFAEASDRQRLLLELKRVTRRAIVL